MQTGVNSQFESIPANTDNATVRAALSLAIETIKRMADPKGEGRRYAQQKLDEIQGMLEPKAPTMVTGGTQKTPAASSYVVATDGACKGNPGPAAWGTVVLCGGHRHEAKGYIGRQTNQIAELCAAIEGLTLTPAGATVELQSDSQYTLKGISEWRRGWERNNWRTSTGGPVANKDYWVRLFALVDARKVTTKWVRGHNGDALNERCDELANEAIAGAV